MRKITLANGQMIEVECLSCTITGGLIQPDGGVIVETEHFHAHQDVAYPIKGLVILASKRHFKCLDEMTEDEQIDYIQILTKIRKAQREVLGIDHVYYFYNEDTTHHFHTWMVPRYEWMDSSGRSVESVRPALLYARNEMNEEANLNEVIKGINALKKGFGK
ncbi:HIT family protein [Psychrobacillus sp. NPDC093180]|uniref:HIT family protein n=1 Tax=Psychrobacillus sp. NPDC093180 TaxID=3364489 RepID=UPI003802F904